MNRFFTTSTLARYGEIATTTEDAERAIYFAERLIQALENYPDWPFHPPVS